MRPTLMRPSVSAHPRHREAFFPKFEGTMQRIGKGDAEREVVSLPFPPSLTRTV